MSGIRHVAVIDIGKTNIKLVLVDLASLSEIAVRKQPNHVLPGPLYPHYDTEAQWRFILESLRELHGISGIDAITVTTHGASAALIDAKGELAAPVLDYEHTGPDSLAKEYDAIRPEFAETGSPRLPAGLNLGAQLFWQFSTFPEIRAKTKTILTFPQYWTLRLTGQAFNEVSSLGCHTDLWAPGANGYSSLVEKQGWSDLMAPLAQASDLAGPVTAAVAKATGLGKDTPVYCGIHDSNASLYAHLVRRQAPFAVVSSGTWVISMAIGGEDVMLDPARDTLINVSARGEPVPSARFMGGRELELLMDGYGHNHSQADIDAVLAREVMLLPSVVQGSGPFPDRAHRWSADEESLSDGERFVAVSFYLALMTATGLEITGARGEIAVEGPLAGNRVYRAMLSAATGRPVKAVAGTGTSIGAALLAAGEGAGGDHSDTAGPSAHKPDAAMAEYAEMWDALTDQ